MIHRRTTGMAPGVVPVQFVGKSGRAAVFVALASIGVAVVTGCPPPATPGLEPALIADPPPSDGGVPGAGIADFDRGLAYLKNDAFKEAIPLFDRSLEVQPGNAQAWYYRGLCKERTADVTGAVQDYRKALELDDGLVEAAINLGALYLDGSTSPDGKTPQAEQAIEVLLKAVSKVPNEPDVRENLALAYRLAKKYDQAAEQYQKALKLGESARLRFAFGDMLFEARKAEAAAEQLSKALPGFVDDVPVLVTIGRMLSKCKAYEACIDAFDKVIAKRPKEADWHIHRGLCLLGQKKGKAARKAFQTAIKLNPKSAPAHYYLGMAWLADNNRRKAAKAFEDAAKHGKGTPWAKKARAEFKKMAAGVGKKR